MTLGATARLPSFHLLGDWARTTSRARSDGDFLRTSETGEFITHEPMRFSFGVGVHGERFHAEFDTFFNVGDDAMLEANIDQSVANGTDASLIEPAPAHRREPVDPTANLGVGAEWPWTTWA